MMPAAERLTQYGGMFTVNTPKRGAFTFEAQRVDGPKPVVFVKLIDAGRTVYLGKLDIFLGQVMPTQASKLTPDAYPVKLVNRVLARLWSDDYAAITRHGYDVSVQDCVPF